MEEVSQNNNNTDDLGLFLQMLPQFIDNFRAEFELLSGKRLLSNLSSVELGALERKIKKIYILAQKLEKLNEKDLTPTIARKRLALINDSLRLAMTRIPKGQEPIDYLIYSIKRLRRAPSNKGLPKGFDFTSKYKALSLFVDRLLKIVPKPNIDSFLASRLSEHQLVPQFQRALNNLLLPKALRTPPTSTKVQTMEKLKLALHDVINDWEGLVEIVYGLILLKEHQVSGRSNKSKSSLREKVNMVEQEPGLNRLAKSEWVTVRNAIAHGKAFLIPSEGKISFPDRNRTISWTPEQAYLEAVDIYLANVTILSTWNLVQTYDYKNFIKYVIFLRAKSNINNRTFK